MRIRKQLSRIRDLMDKDIWELEHLGRQTARARFYLLLRILTLTFQGLRRNKLPVQSAALTFYSLIGIGPLIALGIMVSSFLIDQSPANPSNGESPAENRAVEWIETAITYAAPQLSIDTNDDDIDNAELAPEITEMINSFIDAAQSGTVGVVGSLMLFVIGIQVLSSIEASFNSLWGVDQGRKIGERIVVYWTFISLGAVMGAAALTLSHGHKHCSINGETPLWRRVSIPCRSFQPDHRFYSDHHTAGGLLPFYPQYTSQLEGSLHRSNSSRHIAPAL